MLSFLQNKHHGGSIRVFYFADVVSKQIVV